MAYKKMACIIVQNLKNGQHSGSDGGDDDDGGGGGCFKNKNNCHNNNNNLKIKNPAKYFIWQLSKQLIRFVTTHVIFLTKSSWSSLFVKIAFFCLLTLEIMPSIVQFAFAISTTATPILIKNNNNNNTYNYQQYRTSSFPFNLKHQQTSAKYSQNSDLANQAKIVSRLSTLSGKENGESLRKASSDDRDSAKMRREKDSARKVRRTCAAPEVLVNGSPSASIGGTVSGGDLSSIDEIVFVGQVASTKPANDSKFRRRDVQNHMQKRICKIKCLDGLWVGPLCAFQSADQFKPIFRPCRAPVLPNATVVRIWPSNRSHNRAPSSASQEIDPDLDLEARTTQFPPHHHRASNRIEQRSNVSGRQVSHGTQVAVRCAEVGVYRLTGAEMLSCVDGLWSGQFGGCVPTTIHHNLSLSHPPTILYTLIDGTLGVDERGRLMALPGSNLYLDCLFPKSFGQPQWNVSELPRSQTSHRSPHLNGSRHAAVEMTSHVSESVTPNITAKRSLSTGWAIDSTSHSWKYRLAIYYATVADSGRYTCNTPHSHSNWLDIVVQEVECAPISTLTRAAPDPHRVMSIEGHRMHDRVRFSCVTGYRLVGSRELRCRPDARWSAPIPACEEIACAEPSAPPDGHLMDASGGRYLSGDYVQYGCAAGHVLDGAPIATCQPNGTWSHQTPKCIPVCEFPASLAHGALHPTAFNYRAGDRVRVQCAAGYRPKWVDSLDDKSESGSDQNLAPQRELASERDAPRITMTIECGPDGRWSDSFPICQPI